MHAHEFKTRPSGIKICSCGRFQHAPGGEVITEVRHQAPRAYHLNNSGHRWALRPNPELVQTDSAGQDIPGARPFRARYFEAVGCWAVAVRHDGRRVSAYREVR